MYRQIWRVILPAMGILTAVAFVGCQTDVTEPTNNRMGVNVTDDYGMIYGYVKTAGDPPQPISGATVTWYPEGFPEETLGTATTSAHGYYQIDGESWWAQYTADKLEGKAEHASYETGYNYIAPYVYPNSYMRNFFLSGSE